MYPSVLLIMYYLTRDLKKKKSVETKFSQDKMACLWGFNSQLEYGAWNYFCPVTLEVCGKKEKLQQGLWISVNG